MPGLFQHQVGPNPPSEGSASAPVEPFLNGPVENDPPSLGRSEGSIARGPNHVEERTWSHPCPGAHGLDGSVDLLTHCLIDSLSCPLFVSVSHCLIVSLSHCLAHSLSLVSLSYCLIKVLSL